MNKERIQRWIDWLFNLLFIGILLVVIWIVWIVFFFASFHIPTDSMEPTLKGGDVVWVFKPTLGARIFNVNASLRHEQPTIYRIPGIRHFKRNDVLVFNFPHPNNWNKIEMHILKYYVKRCIGLPGDTLSIRNGFYQVKGFDQPLGNIEAQNQISHYKPEDFPKGIYASFPFDSILNWNIQNFGPLYIPKKEDEIKMNRTNFVLYRKVIEWEQGKTLSYHDSTVFLDGHPIRTYRFRKDYYFMGGDNGINSQDSRYWGLLPEEYIVGKVWKVWKSIDPYTNRFRWDRFLLDVK